jgi:hypothetical protein
MKLIITLFVTLLTGTVFYAQVGINNTDPKASLDITATNQANPSNTDGLLIPRIDDFPVTNPTADQNGMMVYLTTASGSNAPGYYYWDNGASSWIKIFGTDDQQVDLFALSGTTLGISLQDDGVAPVTVDLSSLAGDNDWTDVGSDIERQTGDVYIGNTYTTDNNLYVSNRIIDWDNNLYFIDPNSNSKVDEIEFDSGSLTDPSIRFSDADTGFYSPLSATTAYSTNGSEVFRINSQGNISIGTTSTFSNYKMYIKTGPNPSENDIYLGNTNNSNSSILINHNSQQGDGITVNSNNGYTLSNRSAIYATNALADISTDIARYSTASNIYGIYSSIQGLNNYTIYGVYNYIPNTGGGTHYGIQNRLNGSGNGAHYGTYNILSGNGYGVKYGSYNTISNTAGGTHYGVFSDAQKSTGYAGYFIGRMSLGNTTANRYLMPASDGSANQVMATDGSGNLSWVTPNTGTDDQTIDQFGLVGTTLGLSLEDDGVAPVTVDLSSLQDGTGTDDQNLTGATLTGTSLQIDIENGTSATVNLASLQDADWHETGGTPPNNINDNIYTNGKVGINNPSPSSSLDIISNSTGTIGQLSLTENQANDGARILFNNSTETTNKWTIYARADNTTTDNYFNIHNSTVGNILIAKGDGKIGIGTVPTYQLDVEDSQSSNFIARFNNSSTGTNANGIRIRLAGTNLTTSNYFIGFYRGIGSNSGKIVGSGTGVLYQTTSDRRLKTNIISVENALDIISKIQPRKYQYKANLETKEYGFIAQELQLVYPQAVSGNPNGNVETDPMMVDYSRLTPILTAGIKELNQKVKYLIEKNKKQEQELKKLRKKLLQYSDLETRLELLENKIQP